MLLWDQTHLYDCARVCACLSERKSWKWENAFKTKFTFFRRLRGCQSFSLTLRHCHSVLNRSDCSESCIAVLMKIRKFKNKIISALEKSNLFSVCRKFRTKWKRVKVFIAMAPTSWNEKEDHTTGGSSSSLDHQRRPNFDLSAPFRVGDDMSPASAVTTTTTICQKRWDCNKCILLSLKQIRGRFYNLSALKRQSQWHKKNSSKELTYI